MRYPPIIALIIVLAVAATLCSSTVTNIEYFFDSDPGPGNGTQIYGRNSVSMDEIIATGNLEPGIHRLFVRAKNDQGIWGLPQSARFFIPYTGTAFEERSVDTIEYYFNADPGPGNGTQIYGRTTVSLDEMIATSPLEPGIHRLYVRAKNDEGVWGLPQSKRFFIPYPGTAFVQSSVTAIEYFFDTDPGPGNAIPIYGRNMVELDQLLATTGLPSGIHRLFVRAKNDDGKWGLPQSIVFLIPWTADPETLIIQLEYYIDIDPGFGNGTPVPVIPGTSVSASFPVSVGPLTHGNHCLYVRAKNSNGGWGLPACCQFSDGIPAHLTINVSAETVTLSWEDLYGIDTYKVHSALLPDGVYAEDAGGIFGPSTWTAPESGPKRFYRVTSIYGE